MEGLQASLSDAEVAEQLDAISSRLAALATDPDLDVGAELAQIRADLHRLAAVNAEVRQRLETSLGLAPLQ